MMKNLMNLCALSLFLVSVVGCQGAGFSTDEAGVTFGSDGKSRDDDAKGKGEHAGDQDAGASKSDDAAAADAYEIPVQWPPNHRMERFTLESIPGESDLSVCKIASISSNEVDKSGELDDVAEDYKILDALTFEVRIERLGTGEGRVYSIQVVCGAEGEEGREHVFKVSIPHDWREEGPRKP